MGGTIEPFGTVNGVDVWLYTIAAPNGIRAAITPYGARLVQLWVPDRSGHFADVVLGHADVSGYIAHRTYFGATCGRYANRIAGGRFALDGAAHQLDLNEGANHLHGGHAGFDTKVWNVVSHDARQITLAATSPAGEMGYPGTCEMQVIYRIDGARLSIEMTATTDAATVINMVNHSYINLGAGGDILGHILQIDAPDYTPVTADLLTTGHIQSVAGTGFDFRAPRRIADVMADDADLVRGYDHNWCLAAGGDAMVLIDPQSGRRMRLRTNQPGVQIYTFGQQNGMLAGKDGGQYGRFAGLTLETQTYPCAPNHLHFPSAVLRPDALYFHNMELIFDTV